MLLKASVADVTSDKCIKYTTSHIFCYKLLLIGFSQNLYRSDLNFMRGVGCITPGALEIEAKKKASELISEVTKEGFDFCITNKDLPDVSVKLGWQRNSLD